MESAELIAVLQEVRERVRSRYPEGSAPSNIPLADLMPLVHARDAALGKVAAIGSVNPRRGGPINALAQTWKKFVARVLDWHVREQVEFNRKIVTCVDAAIEALTETNRALVEAGSRIAANNQSASSLLDATSHWHEWRADWERKLRDNEVQFLRSVADLQAGFQHRVTLMDATHREAMLAQNADFTGALARAGEQIQSRLWDDMERIRTEYERIIFAELKTLRQRAAISAAQPPASTSASSTQSTAPAFDYARFAEKFRGPEEYVKNNHRYYLPHFEGGHNVLDLGCGRGEFLEMMREANISARGIDLDDHSIALCKSKSLDAERADLFEHLSSLTEASLDGIFCSQVVEHLPPERLPEMIKLSASRLSRNGVLVIETPNPECLAIFSTHFYLDPTHTRPIPPALLAFYMEEFGIGRLETRRFALASESMPPVNTLPIEFRDAYFGPLDYAVIGKKL